MLNKFDFIIVGGGSSGCVLANRLSESGNFNVCLIEAGGDNNSALVSTPIATALLMRLKKFNYCLNSTPQPTQNNRQIFNPRGKGLGGSSAVNAMLYIRGQKEDYDEWEAMGNQGWGFKDVLPYFKSTEHQLRIKNEYHSNKGELCVSDSRSVHPTGAQLVRAGINMGFPFNPDFNGKSQLGVGYYQLTQKNGKRCSAAHAFLNPAKQRNNLTILTEHVVNKVLFDGDLAIGVEAYHNGKLETLSATMEVILSAGAIHTPQLLMLSGVGNRSELEKHDIDVVKELNGVGKNLQDHVDIITVNKHKRNNVIVIEPSTIVPFIKEVFRFIVHKTGLMTTSYVEVGGFVPLDSDSHRPDIQWQFIGGAMDDHGRNMSMFFKRGTSMHTCLLRPKSRGEITLQDNSIRQPPLINSNMLSHPDDMKDMIKAVKITRKLFTNAPFKSEISEGIFPSDDIIEDEQIEQFIREKSNNIYHPVGTCKMGSDDMSVVNAQLQVHGLKNLRVVDASIMPTLISGNTNAPCIMIAAKAADMILARHQ